MNLMKFVVKNEIELFYNLRNLSNIAQVIVVMANTSRPIFSMWIPNFTISRQCISNV